MVLQAPASVTDLANLALDMLGQNAALLDLESDVTSPGRALRRAFWQSWDETLRAAPWNCARKRVSLPALEETPAWGFDTYYALPGDYMNVQEISGVIEGDLWEVEETPAGVKAVACDLEAPLLLAYTYQLRDIAKADAAFKGAFVAHLAATVSPPITRDEPTTRRCWTVFREKVTLAQMFDSREAARRRAPDSQVVSIRD